MDQLERVLKEEKGGQEAALFNFATQWSVT
jgi:hypothetical protein